MIIMKLKNRSQNCMRQRPRTTVGQSTCAHRLHVSNALRRFDLIWRIVSNASLILSPSFSKSRALSSVELNWVTLLGAIPRKHLWLIETDIYIEWTCNSSMESSIKKPTWPATRGFKLQAYLLPMARVPLLRYLFWRCYIYNIQKSEKKETAGICFVFPIFQLWNRSSWGSELYICIFFFFLFFTVGMPTINTL